MSTYVYGLNIFRVKFLKLGIKTDTQVNGTEQRGPNNCEHLRSINL